ncbi:MAG: hypothetical protein KGJ42_06815 [Acidobacteriota bacterium]|nr:hypothetical protein [Acidobacteriota bacterium]
MTRRTSRRPTWLIGLAAGALASSAVIASLLSTSNSALGLPTALQVGVGVAPPVVNAPGSSRAATTTPVGVAASSRALPTTTTTSPPQRHPGSTASTLSRVITVNTSQPVTDSQDSNTDGNSQSTPDGSSSPNTSPSSSTSSGDN